MGTNRAATRGGPCVEGDGAGCGDDVLPERVRARRSGPAPEPGPVRYAVDFRGARGEGLVELGPGGRACITLDVRLPEAAHLHRASRKGPADSILVTFFEPPTAATRRTCIEDADP